MKTRLAIFLPLSSSAVQVREGLLIPLAYLPVLALHHRAIAVLLVLLPLVNFLPTMMTLTKTCQSSNSLTMNLRAPLMTNRCVTWIFKQAVQLLL